MENFGFPCEQVEAVRRWHVPGFQDDQLHFIGAWGVFLVRAKLLDRTKCQHKIPSGIYKCNHSHCLTCPFLQEGQNKYTFSATKEERHINDTLNCKSKKT